MEPGLRWLYASVFFHGNQFCCNICGHRFSAFITVRSGDKICPFCGSLPRSRRLLQLLLDENLLIGKVLHFSPSRSLYRYFKSLAGIHYLSSDFANEFMADRQLDITAIDLPDKSIDTILCLHILEHIENDLKAMRELYRILKPGGKVIIQTPFKIGDIYENPKVQTPEEREKHFGQADHVRIYSLAGLKGRLEQVGLEVSVRSFRERTISPQGFKAKEVFLIASKLNGCEIANK